MQYYERKKQQHSNGVKILSYIFHWMEYRLSCRPIEFVENQKLAKSNKIEWTNEWQRDWFKQKYHVQKASKWKKIEHSLTQIYLFDRLICLSICPTNTHSRHFSRSIINLKTFGHVSPVRFSLLRLHFLQFFINFVCSIADNLLDIYSNCFAKKKHQQKQPNMNEIFIECNECTANIKSGNSIFTRVRVLLLLFCFGCTFLFVVQKVVVVVVFCSFNGICTVIDRIRPLFYTNQIFSLQLFLSLFRIFCEWIFPLGCV